MKFNPKKRKDLGTRRTLHFLLTAFASLIAKNPFEKITVKQICDESYVPRATFYNYFEDKYDLLEYSCDVLIDQVSDNIVNWDASFSAVIDGMCELFDMVDSDGDLVRTMLANNPPEGILVQTFVNRVSYKLKAVILNSSGTEQSRFSPSLVSRLCANVMLLLLEYKISHIDTFTKEDATEFLLTAINYQNLGLVYEK